MNEVRELTAADLTDAAEDGIVCPRFDCGEPPESGTHRFDDRGPFQLISVYTYRCGGGHEWTRQTDGG